MKNIWLSEMERTFKRKKTWIAIAIFLLLIPLEGIFLSGGNGVSFYSPSEEVLLNSLNTAPFFLRELGIFLHFILIPMLVVDSFNGEYTSGMYRLILLRPQGRSKLFLIKTAVQAMILFGLLVMTLIGATIYGKLAFPEVTEVSFLQTESLEPFQAFLYTVAFYLIAFLVCFAVMSVSSLISTIMPNTILSYVGIISFLIGSIYLSDQLSFLISFSDSIFQVMGNQNDTMLALLFLLIFLSNIINIIVWKKRNWMC